MRYFIKVLFNIPNLTILCVNAGILFMMFGCSSGSTTGQPVSNYLMKPTGQYGVGFQDFHYITGICPDPYYSESTTTSFSPGNTNHCHEIMTRIYYPTDTKIETPTTPYYLPIIQTYQTIAGVDNITEAQVQTFNSWTSYTIPNAPVVNGLFPVILFAPGAGAQAQSYENIITQLVSNGYIVIGKDSVFANGNIQLPSGIITQTPSLGPKIPCTNTPTGFPVNCTESEWVEYANLQLPQLSLQESDIYFVLNQLESQKSLLTSAMDFQNIGGFGHSLGARAINNIIVTNPTLFKAAAVLDVAPIGNGESYPLITTIPIPIMFGMSANFKTFFYPNITFNLNKNSYYVGFSPNSQNQTYSEHLSYSDEATLQYQPLVNQFLIWEEQNNIDPLLGNGNGIEIINSVNTYLLQFFDTYLKNQPNNVFNTNNCNILTSNTFIACGPGTFH